MPSWKHLLRTLSSTLGGQSTKTSTQPQTRQFAQVRDIKIEVVRVPGAGQPAPPEEDFFEQLRRGVEEGAKRQERGKGIEGEEKEIGEHRVMEKNVLNQPLRLHSTRPLTGFLRTGYCEAPPSDFGNHSVAAILTNPFLDFSASRGNDLRASGLTAGCKWCLCASRWKEAFLARSSDQDEKVPRVVLSATNARALEEVSVDELRKFAVDAVDKGEGK